MRFSLARWFVVSLGIGSVALSALAAEAAELRTAAGKRQPIARTAHQEPAENAPSVMTPKKPAARTEALPPPTATRSRAPVEMHEYSQHGVLHDDAFHGEYSHTYVDQSCGPVSCGWTTWAHFDYLLWWRSGVELPPLVATSPVGTPQGQAGQLGLPTTTVLYGDGVEEFPVRPGGRIDLGLWTDDYECLGFGGRFYWLTDAENNFNASSGGSPILAIPFREGSNNAQDARLVAFPGVFNGNLDFTTSSEVLGGDLYARMQWCQMSWGQVDLLAGYQYARINEGILLDSTVSDLGGATNRVIDSFATRNEFHGGSLGLATKFDNGCWYIDMMGKVGVGNMQEQVIIRGQSISTVGGTSSVLNNSGLFAQPTNVGTYSRDQMVVIPELGVNVGWHITECIDFRVGYTFIYFSGLVRPGDAIDTTVNTTQAGAPLVGPARPAFAFNDSDFVAHGLNLGVTFRW